MKINFPSLFKTSLTKFKFFFIYGNDSTVFERSIFFLQKELSAVVKELSEGELITSDFFRPSLFDNHSKETLYLVPNVSDKILPTLNSLHKGIYVFTSLKARAQSKLVTHFSQCPNGLAIPAYSSPVTTSEFEFLVRGMTVPLSFKGALFKAYQNDYTGLLSTLDKIRLYGDVTELQNEFLLKSYTYLDEFSPLIHAILLRDLEKAAESSSYLLPTDLLPFFRTLMRSFLVLLDLMPFKGSAKSIPWYSLKSSIFFKDQPVYEAALSRWSPHEVHIFLEKLLSLEMNVKYSSFQNSSVFPTLFLEIKNNFL